MCQGSGQTSFHALKKSPRSLPPVLFLFFFSSCIVCSLFNSRRLFYWKRILWVYGRFRESFLFSKKNKRHQMFFVSLSFSVCLAISFSHQITVVPNKMSECCALLHESSVKLGLWTHSATVVEQSPASLRSCDTVWGNLPPFWRCECVNEVHACLCALLICILIKTFYLSPNPHSHRPIYCRQMRLPCTTAATQRGSTWTLWSKLTLTSSWQPSRLRWYSSLSPNLPASSSKRRLRFVWADWLLAECVTSLDLHRSLDSPSNVLVLST